MTEERYAGFRPPRAPGARRPPHFDATQPPGRPVDAPDPPQTGAPDQPPPQHEPAPPASSPPGADAPPGHGEHRAPAWTPSGAAGPRTLRRDGTNGYAVASLVLGIAGAVVFVLGPLGLAFVLNLPASILAWVFGAKGRRRVDRGELTRQRGLAQTGFVLGVVGTVVGVVAVVVWALVLALDDGVRQQLIDQFERAVEQGGVIR